MRGSHVKRSGGDQRSRVRSRCWTGSCGYPAFDRFEADARPIGTTQLPKQGDADSGLAHSRPAAQHYDARHASVTAAISRSMSLSSKVALTVIRSRAEPAGTVGGRTAWARIPSSDKRDAAAIARWFSPRITETIGPEAPRTNINPASWSAARNRTAFEVRAARNGSA